MLVPYLLTLAASAAIAGVFGREVLTDLGFVYGFQNGLTLAGGFACLYIALQCAYMTLIRFLEPSRSPSVYITEILSHLSAAILLPFLAGIEVQWPHEALTRVEPLVYLAAFTAVHLAFKLASFFASLQGDLGSRLSPLGWLAGTAVFSFVAYSALTRWAEDTEASIPAAPTEVAGYTVGTEFALARRMPEGAVYEWDMEALPGQSLLLRWAPTPEDASTSLSAATVHVSVSLDGDERKDFYARANVAPDGWAKMRVPSTAFPENVRSGRIRWAREETSSWQQLLGIAPVVYGDARSRDNAELRRPEMLMSGPFAHAERPEASKLNFVVVLVDGLSSSRISALSDADETTPAIDRLATVSLVFRNAFTPMPDARAALTTMLTGVVPLRHGVVSSEKKSLADSATTLPELLQDDRYATAAFLEQAGGDLLPGKGIERGFEVVATFGKNDSDDPLVESRRALAASETWIGDHLDEKFYVVIRVRGLVNALEQDEGSYDEALSGIDSAIASLVTFVREHQTRRKTCIVLTAPFAMDFSGRRAIIGLTEPSLNVPLIIHVPGLGGTQRIDPVGLEDLPALIARITQTRLPSTIDGQDFLNSANGNRPISVWGDPPTATMRTKDWRYTWAAPGADAVAPLGLFRVSDQTGWWSRDLSASNRERAQRYREELEAYVLRQRERSLR